MPFPPISIPTPRNRHMHAAIHALDRVVAGIIKERRERDTDLGDLLSMRLSVRDEERGEGMNDHQAGDEIMTLLLAGHETTANTLTWIWYLLSEHPEAESRLHAELTAVLGGNVPAVEHLPHLTYTSMVLQETLRLYPPLWVISHKAISADELGGYPIPPGSIVILNPYATHRHPAFREQQEVFERERFTPERAATAPIWQTPTSVFKWKAFRQPVFPMVGRFTKQLPKI